MFEIPKIHLRSGSGKGDLSAAMGFPLQVPSPRMELISASATRAEAGICGGRPSSWRRGPCYYDVQGRFSEVLSRSRSATA